MNLQVTQFPILNPWQPMPKGIAFKPSLAEAIDAVVTRDLYASLWRPVYHQDLIATFMSTTFTDFRKKPDDKTARIPEGDLFNKFSLVQSLFTSLKIQMSRHYDSFSHDLSAGFTYSHQGAYDIVHCDTIGGKNLQALVVLKGQGTWIMSPAELKLAGHDKFWEKIDNSIETCPPELVYQLATGDVIFWRNDFPHAGPPVTRPEEERLVGLMVSSRKPA